MADETAVIKIQYDTEDANQSINKLTNAIDNNRTRLVELKKELKDNKISQLDYKKQTEELTQSINRDTFERKKYINVIQAEIGSVKRAKAENQIMREERNKLSTETVEGRKKIEEYNKKIDKNTEYIKANVDGQSRMFMTLGKVSDSLKAIPGPIGGVIQGIGGMTKAAGAFVANPIGAVIAAIGAALTLLIKAFKRSEEGSNQLNKALSVLKGVMNVVMGTIEGYAKIIVKAFQDPQKAITDLWELIKENLINRIKGVIDSFKAFGKVLEGVFTLDKDKIKEGAEEFGESWIQSITGVDDQIGKLKRGFKEFSKQVKEGIALAEQLADAEAKLQGMQRNARLTQLNYQKDAEKLRQIRDDENKTMFERIAANQKLGETLKKQAGEELSIAYQALRVADLRIKAEGDSATNLDARAAALTEVADIQERIASQESEQLVNINSLERERIAILKERQAELLAIETKMDEDFEKSQLEFDEYLEQQYAREEAALAEALATEQDMKLQAGEEEIAAFKKKEEQKRELVNLTLSTIKSTSETFFNWQNQKRSAELETLRFNYDQQIEAFKAKGISTAGLEKQFAARQKALLKKQDQAAKRQAIFKIAMDTAGAIVAGIRQFGPPPSPLGIAAITSATLIGGTQAAAILRAPEPQYAKGGIIGGKSHAEGGTHFVGSDGSRFEAERGEAMFVLKKDATAQIAALSAINERFGGRSFTSGASHLADGGSVQPVDIEGMVNKVMQQTPIVVKVSDISLGLTSVDKVKSAGVI